MGLLPSVNVKDILELVKAGATIEAQEQIMALRQAALDLQEENIALREHLKELKAGIELNQQLTFDGEVYWRRGDGGTREGPFCPKCKDAAGKLIRLHSRTVPGRPFRWRCGECRETFRFTR